MALASALTLAREHGSPTAALEALGLDLEDAERLDGISGGVARVLASRERGSAAEALALGFLAGRAAHHGRAAGAHDPSSFLMDADLVVRAADGQSILRLPWFEDDLFVARQLPDIAEMPTPVRLLCIEHYRAALAGERRRFAFTSYGHSYSVDARPVRADDGRVRAVLAVATRTASSSPAVRAYERRAEILERAATLAEAHAERHRRAGRGAAEDAERHAAHVARTSALRARALARRLESGGRAATPAEPPALTPRETEVLLLASHGLTYAEIAEHLVVTVATVRTHLEHIYPKLGVGEKAGAVAVALRHGLIE